MTKSTNGFFDSETANKCLPVEGLLTANFEADRRRVIMAGNPYIQFPPFGFQPSLLLILNELGHKGATITFIRKAKVSTVPA